MYVYVSYAGRQGTSEIKHLSLLLYIHLDVVMLLMYNLQYQFYFYMKYHPWIDLCCGFVKYEICQSL